MSRKNARLRTGERAGGWRLDAPLGCHKPVIPVVTFLTLRGKEGREAVLNAGADKTTRNKRRRRAANAPSSLKFSKAKGSLLQKKKEEAIEVEAGCGVASVRLQSAVDETHGHAFTVCRGKGGKDKVEALQERCECVAHRSCL